MIQYLIMLSLALFAIGVSGIATSRHLIVIVLGVELIISAGTILAASFFEYVSNGNIVLLLFTLWSFAVIEVLAAVVVYRYMIKHQATLDVTKFSRLKG